MGQPLAMWDVIELTDSVNPFTYGSLNWVPRIPRGDSFLLQIPMACTTQTLSFMSSSCFVLSLSRLPIKVQSSSNIKTTPKRLLNQATTWFLSGYLTQHYIIPHHVCSVFPSYQCCCVSGFKKLFKRWIIPSRACRFLLSFGLSGKTCLI